MNNRVKILISIIFISIILLISIIFIMFLTGKIDQGIAILSSVISAAVLAIGAIVFKSFLDDFQAWLSSGSQSTPGTIKVFVYGRSGSGKTTFIENALSWGEERPAETQAYGKYPARVNLSFRPGAKGDGQALSEGTTYVPEEVNVLVADYRGQEPWRVVVNPDPDFFGEPGGREVDAVLFIVDFVPAYKHEDGSDFSDEEVIAEVSAGAEMVIRRRAEAHSKYLSDTNIGIVFAVALSPARRNLKCVKLIINKRDILEKLVRKGLLPNVTRATYPGFEHSLFGEIRSNIREFCKKNRVRDFSVLHLNANDLNDTAKVFRSVLVACGARRDSRGT